MKIFDISTSLNPTLVDGALILVGGEIHQVIDMDSESISVENRKYERAKINDTDWVPIDLTEEWLAKFNLKVTDRIRNITTDLDWIIKSTGRYYYITIYRDPSFGDNPVIGLNYVHDLQRWFYILAKQKVLPNFKTTP